MNNKGFAISSMIYSILLLFLMLTLGVFVLLGSRKMILDKVKSEIITDIIQYKTYLFSFEHKDILLTNTSKVSNFEFSLLDGVKVMDQNGNVVETEITVASEPTFDSTQNGSYHITYTANYNGTLIEENRTIQVVDPVVYEYAYSGKEQQFTVPANGIYRTELWGGSGMSQTEEGKAGKGGYVSGDISLTSNTHLHIYVGGSSNWGNAFNAVAGTVNGFSGGGATDVRLTGGEWNQFESLKSRIMVAGGGGGSEWPYAIGGDAGGLVGSTGYGTDWSATDTQIKATGGTQVSGGISEDSTAGDNGGFGFAGYNTDSTDYGGMGGGGYYGGASKDAAHAGGGGSSFISGHAGCNAILENSTQNNVLHSNQPNHYSGYVFLNTVMKAGNEEMPSVDGQVVTGNVGSGHAKVTALIIDNGKLATNLIKNSGFEKGTENWAFSSVELVSNVSASGRNAIKFSPSVTAMSTQSMNPPIPGHIYYGSIEFLSSNSFTTSDNRFEWYLADTANSLMVFAHKGDKTGVWKKLSSCLSLNTPNSGNWNIRNFLVNANEAAYADDLFIIDLTEIYGAGNEPSKEWCDQNILYFDGVGIVPIYNP